MTYDEAMREARRGVKVRRPSWETGRYVSNRDGVSRPCEFRGALCLGVFNSYPYQRVATDWEVVA